MDHGPIESSYCVYVVVDIFYRCQRKISRKGPQVSRGCYIPQGSKSSRYAGPSDFPLARGNIILTVIRSSARLKPYAAYSIGLLPKYTALQSSPTRRATTPSSLKMYVPSHLVLLALKPIAIGGKHWSPSRQCLARTQSRPEESSPR